MLRTALIAELNALLQPERFKDYAPNGLQVEGQAQVRRVITGVTASEALIDAAIEWQADTILVHHGYFWKGENPCLTGMKRRRLARLLNHNINLLAYHLPLDAHPELGNNACLARELEFVPQGQTGEQGLIWHGELPNEMTLSSLTAHVSQRLGREALALGKPEQTLRRIAWCTGGADSLFSSVLDLDVDVFLTGEASEPCAHIAAETGVAFIAAGHHATERYGIRALGEWLQANTELECRFVDIWNPV